VILGKEVDMIFTRPVLRAALLCITLLIASLGATGAAAAPPIAASGTFSNSGDPTSCRPAGGNTICEFDEEVVTFTGTFNGTAIGHNKLIVHPDGSANFQGFYTFIGTVNGTPGTVTFQANGSGTSDLQFQATYVSISGTGALANLHAVLKQVGTVIEAGPAGTYTGQIQLAE
jgi:hypothetical protein